jgi:sporulation protein YlmC with PRC-barrel domain
VTTINSEAPLEFKRTPNPNVLIELGYAVSAIGWDRIIMVCNTHYGKLEDLPFDINRHRITTFSIKEKTDNNGKGNFKKILETALRSIIEKNPLRPHEKLNLSPEEIKRKNDVKNLQQILSCIHLQTFDSFLDEIPLNIIQRIYDYKEPFTLIFGSSAFHIYDEELYKYLSEFNDLWNTALSFSQHYRPDGVGLYYTFYLIMDSFQSPQAEEDFQKLTQISLQLDSSYRGLLGYIRKNYLEINLDETSKIALEQYRRI